MVALTNSGLSLCEILTAAILLVSGYAPTRSLRMRSGVVHLPERA